MKIDLTGQTLPRYIVIEGPIGAGKTTLSTRLADLLSYQTVLENTQNNPFLAKFYQNPEQYALATQLQFLFQRSEQLEHLQQEDLFEPLHIANFMIEKDQLFAKAILSDDEFKLYNTIFEKLAVKTLKPDLVIYLQAPVHVLAQRIQQRGLTIEQNISGSYLEKISEAYNRFFHYYDDAPLLIVNAAQADILYEENNFTQLVQYMLRIQSGRHYFNPHLADETLL